jgi:hypothetical protein
VFATILAMITDEINNVMLAARSGKAPVALSGHVLLLNWNQQVRSFAAVGVGVRGVRVFGELTALASADRVVGLFRSVVGPVTLEECQ